MTAAQDPWESTDTARAYADFACRHSTYRQTSHDLIALARLTADAKVVDLACGTGTTTEAVLAVVGASGSVVAVDASEAMLAAARASIADERVTWLRGPAERLGEQALHHMDAVVCNSAIWQTNVSATVREVYRVLRPGGRFVFNLGTAMLADHVAVNRSPDSLLELMKAIAGREYGLIAPSPVSVDLPSQELSESWLRHVMSDTGFHVEKTRTFSYQSSLEEQRSWLSIPIFTLRSFGDLSYKDRMTVLDLAYQRLTETMPEPVNTEWMVFTAVRAE